MSYDNTLNQLRESNRLLKERLRLQKLEFEGQERKLDRATRLGERHAWELTWMARQLAGVTPQQCEVMLAAEGAFYELFNQLVPNHGTQTQGYTGGPDRSRQTPEAVRQEAAGLQGTEGRGEGTETTTN